MSKRHRKKFRRWLNNQNFPSEIWFLNKLKNENIDKSLFIRNFPVERYFVDFCFIKFKLAIEIDGSFHNNRVELDFKRDLMIKKLGYEVIRIKFNDNNYAKEVINKIKNLIKNERNDYLINLFI